jgi:hypothetical protein
MGIAVPPVETNAPLVIDSDAVLPSPIAPQLFQSVAGRTPKVRERLGTVQDEQFPQHDPMQRWREASPRLTGEQTLRLAIREAPNHEG